jgi:hypothetical protein
MEFTNLKWYEVIALVIASVLVGLGLAKLIFTINPLPTTELEPAPGNFTEYPSPLACHRDNTCQ